MYTVYLKRGRIFEIVNLESNAYSISKANEIQRWNQIINNNKRKKSTYQ